ANRPGYTRQRLDQIEAVPFRTPQGFVGRGVTDNGVLSIRDTFLDASYRTQQGLYQQADTLHTSVSQIQTLFNEPSDQGLGAALDTLFGAFGDLANNPSNGATRVTVQRDAQQLVTQLHQLDQGITSVTQSAVTQYKAGVDRINQISSQVA